MNTMKKRALITGITGQDGSYLAEYLLTLGYEVFGLVRRTATPNTRNIDHLLKPFSRITLIAGDLLDSDSLRTALMISQPDEVYNLAAQSFVGESWDYPVATSEITGLGTLRLLEAIKNFNRHIRFYQASTSELFGNMPGPQNEKTPFAPRSPYGVAKLFAHHMTVNYRESYGMFAVCGILFNHESERRGEQFVTRKITTTLARIKAGLEDHITLGNLYAKRDWGHAEDYVKAMHAMLQQKEPRDLVIGTGVSHTVEDFLYVALGVAGLKEDVIVIDDSLKRPAEVNELRADAAQARKILKWKPQVNFLNLVKRMVYSDIDQIKGVQK